MLNQRMTLATLTNLLLRNLQQMKITIPPLELQPYGWAPLLTLSLLLSFTISRVVQNLELHQLCKISCRCALRWHLVLVWVLRKVLTKHRNSLLGTQNNLISLSTRMLVQFYSARVIKVLDESKFDIMQSFLKITYHLGCFRCLHLSLSLFSICFSCSSFDQTPMFEIIAYWMLIFVFMNSNSIL